MFQQRYDMENNMKGCIVCNGEIYDYERAKALIADCELVIAADGGAKHLITMNIVPNVIVGDMDSVETIPWQEDEKVEQLLLPRSKDKTDAESSVDLAFERGCRFITLLGASGGRLDHTLGNISLVAKYPGRVAMVDGRSTLVAVDSSEKCLLNGLQGSIVSFIPFPIAEKVTTMGLQYSLEKEDLLPGTRGISNALCQQNGCVCISGGLLLVYIESRGIVDD